MLAQFIKNSLNKALFISEGKAEKSCFALLELSFKGKRVSVTL